jgi:HAD superfamily hydrolase (TIGR01549 family)
MNNSGTLITKLKALLSQKSYVVFDFDKTIAQMEIDWSGWYPGIAEVYGRFEPTIRFEYGVSPHSFHNDLVEKYGKALAKAVNEFNEAYEQRYLRGFTPHQELVDLIGSLEVHTLYVYSSNSKPTVLTGLKELGIIDRFATIITRNDVSRVKPHPEGFSLIPELSLGSELFLMVGDSEADRAAAAAAGIDFLETDYFSKYENE